MQDTAASNLQHKCCLISTLSHMPLPEAVLHAELSQLACSRAAEMPAGLLDLCKSWLMSQLCSHMTSACSTEGVPPRGIGLLLQLLGSELDPPLGGSSAES